MGTIGNLEDIDDTYLKSLGEGFTSLNRNGHLLILKQETKLSKIPEVKHCIDFSTDLRVKLYFKKVPVGLPEWFRQERNTFPTRKTMIVILISSLSVRSEEPNEILDLFNCFQHYEQPVCSYDMILFALELRYTSVQAYEVIRKEMRLASLSFLTKFTHHLF